MTGTLRLSVIVDGQTREATTKVNEVTAALGRLDAQAKQTGPSASAAIRQTGEAAGQAVKLSTQQLAGMQFQLQDIAVGLTSGQSPFTVMMQQGSQLAQSFQSGTGVMAALRAVGSGFTQFISNPLNLAVVGFGLFATAAGTALSGILSQLPDVNRDIEHHEDLVKRIAEAYKDALTRAKEYGLGAPEALQFMGERFQNLFDLEESQNRLRGTFQSQLGNYTPQLQLLRSEIGNPLMGGETEASRAIAAAIDTFLGSATQGSEELNRLFESVKNAARDLPGGDFLRDTVASVVSYGKEAEITAQKLDAGQKQIDYLAGKTKTLGDDAEKAAKSIESLSRKLLGLPAGPNNSRDEIFGSTPITDRPDNSGLTNVPPEMRSLFLNAAEKFNVSADLLARIAEQESGFNPRAVSAAGAQGVMQLMPGTARDLGVQNPLDAAQSIYGGAHYIRQMLDMFAGDVERALVAYNWGPGNAQGWARGGADPSRLPAETRGYVTSVMGKRPGIADFEQELEANRLAKEKVAQKELEYEWSKRIHDQVRQQQQDERAWQKNTAEMLRDAVAWTDQFRGVTDGLVSTIAQARAAGESWTDSFSAGLDMLEGKAMSFLDKFIDGLMDAALFGQKGTSGEGLLGGLLQGFAGLMTQSQNPMQNALGNVFSGGNVVPFARGGIVSQPTYFPMAGGRTGLMGEVPGESEGIFPLARGPAGHLGVRAFGGTGGRGGGAIVNLNVINNAGAEVQTEQRQNADGSIDIDVILERKIDSHLGREDVTRNLQNRLGIRPQAQTWG